MNKIIILLIIIIIFIFRAIVLKLKNSNVSFLIISFFITSTPFVFFKAIDYYKVKAPSGTLDDNIIATLTFLLAIVLLPICKWNRFKLNFNKLDWVNIITILVIISLINPFNYQKTGTISFAIFFLSHIFLFKIMHTFISKEELLRGIYDAFLNLTILHLILAICFPLLKITFVTSLFHEGAGQWATRLGSRDGAVGTFVHPGNLALFTMITSAFFLSTYLYNYNKNLSRLMLVCSSIILILTYSRTSYLTFIIVMFLIYFFKKYAHTNIFSLSNVFKFVIPIGIVIYWLIFLSPWSDIFLASDTDNQFENRWVHWMVALSIFDVSPILGVGLNSHLAFLAKNFSLTKVHTIDEFFSVNPIHNIHLIVLIEVGIIGFIFWLFFIFRNIIIAKVHIASNHNEILSLTLVGMFMCTISYGMSGWAPFSPSILPLFIFITYFSLKYRNILSD